MHPLFKGDYARQDRGIWIYDSHQVTFSDILLKLTTSIQVLSVAEIATFSLL
jgi:hypothetical protein